jgi:hypothetical protein
MVACQKQERGELKGEQEGRRAQACRSEMHPRSKRTSLQSREQQMKRSFQNNILAT